MNEVVKMVRDLLPDQTNGLSDASVLGVAYSNKLITGAEYMGYAAEIRCKERSF